MPACEKSWMTPSCIVAQRQHDKAEEQEEDGEKDEKEEDDKNDEDEGERAPLNVQVDSEQQLQALQVDGRLSWGDHGS